MVNSRILVQPSLRKIVLVNGKCGFSWANFYLPRLGFIPLNENEARSFIVENPEYSFDLIFRDPIKRLVSVYTACVVDKDAKWVGKNGKSTNLFSLMRNFFPTHVYNQFVQSSSEERASEGFFKLFLRHLVDCWYMDIHVQPQHFLYTRKCALSPLSIDSVVLTQNLNFYFKYLLINLSINEDSLGIESVKPINSSTASKKDVGKLHKIAKPFCEFIYRTDYEHFTSFQQANSLYGWMLDLDNVVDDERLLSDLENMRESVSTLEGNSIGTLSNCIAISSVDLLEPKELNLANMCQKFDCLQTQLSEVRSQLNYSQAQLGETQAQLQYTCSQLNESLLQLKYKQYELDETNIRLLNSQQQSTNLVSKVRVLRQKLKGLRQKQKKQLLYYKSALDRCQQSFTLKSAELDKLYSSRLWKFNSMWAQFRKMIGMKS